MRKNNIENLHAKKKIKIGKEGTLFYIHIPKTAGTTMHQIIERQYKPNEIFTINSKRMKYSIDKLKTLNPAKKSKIKMLRGHMDYGLHEFFSKPYKYITILRDPIDRTISHYYYVLNTPHHYLHGKVKSRQMNLQEYVTSGISTELDNAQTRLLSGYLFRTQNADGSIGFGKCSVDMLNKAINNLEKHFTVVGLATKFDETLLLLKRAFRWRLLFYTKMGVAKNRPSKEDLSKDVLKSIEKYNHLDIELYNYAKNIFEDQISEQSQGFRNELKEFKALNRRYGRFLHILSYPLSTLHRIVRYIRNY